MVLSDPLVQTYNEILFRRGNTTGAISRGGGSELFETLYLKASKSTSITHS